MTYEELKKETDDFEPTDFWYWFLSPNHLDMDTKVHIVSWFASGQTDEPIKEMVKYMKELRVIDG